MDLAFPHRPLTDDQIALLAAHRLLDPKPLPQHVYTSWQALAANPGNFIAHFCPEEPGSLRWESYSSRPVFQRMTVLFPRVVANARDCIEPVGDGRSYQAREGTWPYLFQVYCLMAQLVGASDLGGKLDDGHLTA